MVQEAFTLDPHTLAIVIGGFVGALVRAMTTKDHDAFSKRSVQECFVGLLVGVLWQPIAALLDPIIKASTGVEMPELRMIHPLYAAGIVATVSFSASDIFADRGVEKVRRWVKKLLNGKDKPEELK